MKIRDAFTFDDVLLEPARSGRIASQYGYQHAFDPKNQTSCSAYVGGNGYGY
jgi:hypothetical protein